MPYRIKGTLKLPATSQPAAGVDIEFISRRNYSPLLMDLSSIIKTSPTGAYDVTLEFGEYAVVLYWGCNQPSHIGKLFVFADTVTGLDLQTLLQQSDWQPATPEYIQQIQDWLAQSAASASQAVNSAAAAKASEIAAEADRAEVASNKTIVVNAQTDVTNKRSDVTAKAAQVATNTATVNEKTPLAVAAADTASQKAVAAAASDASARDAATRAENAALAMTGAILDGGQCDLSSGFYPPALTVGGKKYSTVWYVQVGGTVSGTKYDAGDKLQYTTANNGFYFRIDARDDVVSVNGEKGAVVLTAQNVGADPAGLASSLVSQHEAKDGAHPISGVAGLEAALADKVDVLNAFEAAPLPDVWIPFNDSLRMLVGFGRDVKVGADTVATLAGFERSTTATYIDKSGVMRPAAINEPRFEKQGLLIEGQSTNLVTNSHMNNWLDGYGGERGKQIENSDPQTKAMIQTVNFITNKRRPFVQNIMTAGKTNTISFRAKVSGGKLKITQPSNTLTGAIYPAIVSGQWMTYSFSGVATTSSVDFQIEADEIHIAYIQVEQLPFSSSYIPTNGAAVTRAADKVTIPRLNNDCAEWYSGADKITPIITDDTIEFLPPTGKWHMRNVKGFFTPLTEAQAKGLK